MVGLSTVCDLGCESFEFSTISHAAPSGEPRADAGGQDSSVLLRSGVERSDYNTIHRNATMRARLREPSTRSSCLAYCWPGIKPAAQIDSPDLVLTDASRSMEQESSMTMSCR